MTANKPSNRSEIVYGLMQEFLRSIATYQSQHSLQREETMTALMSVFSRTANHGYDQDIAAVNRLMDEILKAVAANTSEVQKLNQLLSPSGKKSAGPKPGKKRKKKEYQRDR